MKFDRIILDFDDTIFDDDRFMGDIFVVFSHYNVGKKVFETTYRQTKKSGWDPIRQAKLLFKKLPKNFIDDIERMFSDSNKYIFDDALAFLQGSSISKNILSFGDRRTQLKKIENSGIVSHLDSINVTSDPSKKDFFEKLGRDSAKLIFIDDKPKVINTIKVNFPEVFGVLIKRDSSLDVKFNSLADAIIKTFDDFPALL